MERKIAEKEAKGFSNNRAAEVTIGLTDVVLFAVFLGFYLKRW